MFPCFASTNLNLVWQIQFAIEKPAFCTSNVVLIFLQRVYLRPSAPQNFLCGPAGSARLCTGPPDGISPTQSCKGAALRKRLISASRVTRPLSRASALRAVSRFPCSHCAFFGPVCDDSLEILLGLLMSHLDYVWVSKMVLTKVFNPPALLCDQWWPSTIKQTSNNCSLLLVSPGRIHAQTAARPLFLKQNQDHLPPSLGIQLSLYNLAFQATNNRAPTCSSKRASCSALYR